MKKKSKSLTNKIGHVRTLTRKDIRDMKSSVEVLPPELLSVLPRRKIGQRGAQKKPTKMSVTVRYSAEVLEYFKETGEGWQTRINDVLKQWIKKHPHHKSHHLHK